MGIHFGRRFRDKDHGVYEMDHDDNTVVMAIPDLHCPYQHEDAWDFIKWVQDTYQPDVTICLGDEAEFASLSFHSKDPDAPGAGDEYARTLEALGELYEIVPEALCCVSNHTSRPFRIAYAASVPSMMMKSYEEILQAPKTWSWHDRIVINDVCYIHGDPKTGANAHIHWMKENRMSTVIGHIHGHGGLYTSASPFRKAFGLNSGCLINPQAPCFKYGAKYANKATLGISIIHSSTDAEFIPIERFYRRRK